MSHKLIEALTEFIADEAQLTFNQTNNTIKIEEPENTGSKQLRSVTLKGISEFYFGLKLDHERFQFLGRLLKEGRVRKAMDAILFCRMRKEGEKKAKDYVLLIELKSNDKGGIKEKIKSSKAFLGFIKVALNQYYQIDLTSFIELSILFDRKVTKRGGLPDKIALGDATYFHKGFKKQDNEVWLREFLK